MTPYETWKKNKGRVDLRKYTRDFQKKFNIKTKCEYEPGKVYAVTYRVDHEFPTDKHHVTPIILCLGQYKDNDGKIFVRGINLLYLDTQKTIEVLNDAYPFVSHTPSKRVMPIIKLHDKFMHVYPWVFKNLSQNRILTSIEVPVEEWGLIPLIYKYLLGNFNSVALAEDFHIENKISIKNKKNKPIKESKEQKEKGETVSADVVTTDIGMDEMDEDI